MTVPRPRSPQGHPQYQRDFEEAARPAIHALIVVAESAGWAPETIMAGLRALVRAHVGGNTFLQDKEMKSSRTAKWSRPSKWSRPIEL